MNREPLFDWYRNNRPWVMRAARVEFGRSILFGPAEIEVGQSCVVVKGPILVHVVRVA